MATRSELSVLADANSRSLSFTALKSGDALVTHRGSRKGRLNNASTKSTCQATVLRLS